MGNPLVAATAAKVISDNSPQIMKGVKTGSMIIAGAGLIYFGRKYLKKVAQNKLLRQAGTNPEVRAAVDIYQAIPDGLKKGQGGLFNPIGLARDAMNQVKRIWQRTDTDRILNVAKSIHTKNLDIDKVYRYFYKLYGEQLYLLLNTALEPGELAKFNNYSSSGTASSTPKISGQKYAVVKVNNLNVRKTPENMTWTQVFKKSNKIGTAPFGKVLGLTTGREVFDEEHNVVFVELNVWDTKYKAHIAYAWKGGLKFLTIPELQKEFNTNNYSEILRGKQVYRIDPDSLNGIEMITEGGIG
ncbi:MAG: hypothetical protein KDD36_14980 [Flavobacteriales bacterium]|nr:hypothetical protein [Flavobacteriales bacterium]